MYSLKYELLRKNEPHGKTKKYLNLYDKLGVQKVPGLLKFM